MSESTLSLSITDLQIAVAKEMGIGGTAAAWSAEDVLTIARTIKKGLRQFYFPPQFDPNERPHQWSFLKPVCSLATVAPYSTGTIAIALAGTIVTLTTGVWPSWAATNGTIVINNVEYAIASRNIDGVHITLSAAWTLTTETAATYILYHDGNYDLPDDFGGIEGNITYADESSYKGDIVLVGEGMIRSSRSGSSDSSLSSYPTMAAVRPKEQTTMTTGQRFEIMLYPTPDAAYVLNYRKVILPQMLVDTTLTHPYGGMIHAETIEASCVAIVEMQDNDKRGGKRLWDYFLTRLSASIQADKKICGQEQFGYNSNREDTDDCLRNNRPCKVTYNGITY